MSSFGFQIESPPVSYSFRCQRTQQFSWTLVTPPPTNTPVTGAVVTSTLYANRSLENPVAIPGVADSVFNNIAMPETPALSGVYVGTIPSTFNPSPASQFVIFIQAKDGSGNLLDDWNFRAIIVPLGQPTDLVLLDDVKDWLEISTNNTDPDNALQILISGFSRYVLNRTGRDSFLSTSYTEVYDGNGAQRIALRNSPITNVSSVVIGSYTVPQSTSLTTPGWFIEQSARSIAFRSYGNCYGYGGQQLVPYSIFPQSFYYGIGNMQITYTAGHATIPADLYDAVMETIGVLYARRDWKDLASKVLSVQGGGSGSTIYRSWFLSPGVNEVLERYSRRSLNG